jgi:hypothetical protein
MNDTCLLIAVAALTILLWTRIHYWTQRALRAEAALDRVALSRNQLQSWSATNPSTLSIMSATSSLLNLSVCP